MRAISGYRGMHIILGALTAIISILFILDRLGVDVGWLNPFDWRRRRAFAKQFGADPIYSIEDPMHIASLLIIGAAKLDGELTAQQRQAAQRQFETKFSLSESDAKGLFSSAAHLLAAPQLLENQLGKLADRNRERLSPAQAESLIDMMNAVVAVDGGPSATQVEFIELLGSTFVPHQSEGTWQ